MTLFGFGKVMSFITGEEGEESSPLIREKSQPGQGEDTSYYARRIQPCLVELFGTTIFVFIGTLTAQNQLLLTNAVGHGLTIATLIMAFGKIRLIFHPLLLFIVPSLTYDFRFNPSIAIQILISKCLPKFSTKSLGFHQ